MGPSDKFRNFIVVNTLHNDHINVYSKLFVEKQLYVIHNAVKVFTTGNFIKAFFDQRIKTHI